MVIRYCDKCGQRVQESDLVSGGARELDKERVLCAACAGPAQKSSSARSPGTRVSTPNRDSRRFIPPAAPSSSRSLPRQTARIGASSGRSSNRLLTTVGIVVGAIILIAVIALLLQGKRENARVTPREQGRTATIPTENSSGTSIPPTGATTKTSTSTDDGADYDPRALTAQSLMQQARDYQKSSPNDPWGLLRRLNEVQERYPGTPSAKDAALLQKELNFPSSTPAKELPPENDWARAISLLERANPIGDVNGEAWKREGTALICPVKANPSAMLTLPYQPPDEYDVKVVFVRREGFEAFAVDLPRHGKPISLVLGGWNNGVHGFEMVNAMRADQIPTNLKRRDLINGSLQTLVVQVRHTLFKAYLDGQPLAECTADDGQISVFKDDWGTDRPRQLSIGAWKTVYEFRQILVIERTGKGQLLR